LDRVEEVVQGFVVRRGRKAQAVFQIPSCRIATSLLLDKKRAGFVTSFDSAFDSICLYWQCLYQAATQSDHYHGPSPQHQNLSSGNVLQVSKSGSVVFVNKH